MQQANIIITYFQQNIIHKTIFVLIMSAKSISRCYASVNAEMPSSYWDYDNLQVQWGYAI